jgi:hypothetical protein
VRPGQAAGLTLVAGGAVLAVVPVTTTVDLQGVRAVASCGAPVRVLANRSARQPGLQAFVRSAPDGPTTAGPGTYCVGPARRRLAWSAALLVAGAALVRLS